MYTGEEVVPSGAEESVESINATLRAAINDMPSAMRAAVPSAARRALDIASELELSSVKYLHFAGCGDSYYAGIAAARYVDQLPGIRGMAVEALECSRYSMQRFDDTDLVIPISNSGEVSRTIEVAQRALRGGLQAVAITDSVQSTLARSAGHTLEVGMPKLPSGGAGSRSYLGSLIAAYLLAAAIASKREKTDDYLEQCVAGLEKAANDVEATLSAADGAGGFAQWLEGHDTVVILGAGPHLATALFLGAKLMEAASVHGVVQGLEEWAHEQFHVTDERLPTVVVGPLGASHDRALEQARVVRALGGPVWAVTAEGDSAYADLGGVSSYRAEQSEVFDPFAAAAISALMALSVAEARGIAMRMRLDGMRKELNFQSIFASEITYGEGGVESASARGPQPEAQARRSSPRADSPGPL